MQKLKKIFKNRIVERKLSYGDYNVLFFLMILLIIFTLLKMEVSLLEILSLIK